MIPSGGFLTDIFGTTSNITSGLVNFLNFSFKVMNSYSNEISNINNKKIRIMRKKFLYTQDLI